MVTSLNKETARITELIKQDQLGEVESVWNEALEKAPTEIETFLALADKLAKAAHGEKAGVLLEQVVNKLDELGETRKASTVLGELARVAPRNANQRTLADVVFANAYSDLAGFEKCIERSTEASKGSDNAYVRDLWAQLMFQPGDWVFHDAGWGLGEVKDIDAEAGELKIDFESKEAHKVKLGAAAKFFRKLREDDIMVLRAAHMDELKQRCKDEPVAVVLTVLKCHNNKSNLKRIKAELVPAVIESKSWAKWWTATRKELAQHQYIKLGTGTNPSIDRLVTAMTHEDETRELFDYAIRMTQKLDLLRRYLRDSVSSEERKNLLQHVVEDLKRSVHREAELDDKPRAGGTLAGERILVSWLVDDLKKAEKEIEIDLEYDVDDLIRDGEELLNRLEEIRDPDYQWRSLERHAKLNEDKWAKTLGQAVLKHVPSLWDNIAKKMMEADHHKELRSALEEVNANGEQYPLQTLWICRRGILGTQLPDGFEVLPPNELFGKLLWTINKVLTRIERGETQLKEVLASLRGSMTERNSRLLTTALDGLNEDRAAHLLHEVERCRGLSDIHQSTLRELIMKSYPNLQAKSKLATTEMHEEEGSGEILATEMGRRKRQGELKHIQEEELPDVAKQIGEALAMGDVSENAELDAARERESRLKEAAKEIMDELKRVKVVDPATVDASVAGFGTKVTLKREDGKTKHYTILGRYEADHENFIISNESPIAQGIVGKKPGEQASVETPEGKVQYEVISVDRAE